MIQFKNKYILVTLLALCYFFTQCNPKGNESDNHTDLSKSATIPSYLVISRYAHDTSSFTEGLVFNNGKLYESTGSPEELPFTKSVLQLIVIV